MTDKKIIIAHHSANKQEVNDVIQNLGRAGYTFEQVACNLSGNQLYQRIQETNDRILLLISDNFLRCEDCMFELLPTFQDLIRANRIKAVVADGVYRDEETGIVTTKPTSFDRVSSVIQYMNYWQDQYLDVRRQKRQVPYEKEAVLNDQLKVIRSISSEIGEFLRFLRNRDHTTYEEFRAKNFYSFFVFMNDLTTHSQFEAAPRQMEERTFPTTDNAQVAASPRTKPGFTTVFPEDISEPNAPEIKPSTNPEPIAEPEVDVTEIPGIDMLSDLSVPEVPMEDERVSDEAENLDALVAPEPIPNISELLEETSVELSQEEEEEVVPEPVAVEESALTVSLEVATPVEKEKVTEVGETPQEAIVMEEEQKEKSVEEPVAEEVVEEVQKPSVESILALGNQQIQEGNFYTALHTYEDGLKENPESPALRYTYARGLLKYREDVAGTKKQLKALLEYDAQNTDAFYLLGEIEEIQENYSAAKSNFEQAIAIDSSYPNANYRLANLLANKFDGMEESAAQYFAAAIEQDVQNADAHYQYAILQDEFFKNKEQAIVHFQQTIAQQEDHPFAHYDLAVLYHDLGQTAPAKSAYERAVALNPEVKTPQNDQVFLGIVPTVEKETATPHVDASEIEASKELIHKLQEDIKRLEDLVLKNQDLLQTAQNDIANLPVAEAEEETVPLATVAKEVKTILITGATSGIGRATAEVFAANGHRLILTGRRSQRLEELQAAYQENFDAEILIQNFDVRDPHSVEEMVENLPEEWRSIDILINNAGLAKGFEAIHEGKLEDWETMIDTNVKGLLYMSRAISPLMVERGTGHIINVCSIAGKEVYPNGGVYCATKHAVDALTKGMRLDLHKFGIRVSQVAPAHVEETEFALVRYDGDQERAKIYEDFQPLKSSDVADTIHYIATRPKHVNIQDIVLLGTQQASATVIDRSGRPESAEEEPTEEESQELNGYSEELELSDATIG
ncbi:MAG: SDR family NAD(P)-dependent oxidoreductase [Bacteroidota bacterium]